MPNSARSRIDHANRTCVIGVRACEEPCLVLDLIGHGPAVLAHLAHGLDAHLALTKSRMKHADQADVGHDTDTRITATVTDVTAS